MCVRIVDPLPGACAVDLSPHCAKRANEHLRCHCLGAITTTQEHLHVGIPLSREILNGSCS